jgi:hypothetical protein
MESQTSLNSACKPCPIPPPRPLAKDPLIFFPISLVRPFYTPLKPPIYPLYKTFKNSSGDLSSINLKESDVTRVLGGHGPAIALTNGVAIIASVLTVVGRVRLGPGTSVHAAVSSLRISVLAQDIGVEEVAGVVGPIAARVLVRVLVGGETSTSALVGVVGSSVPSGAHVTAGGLSSSCKFDRSVERSAVGRRSLLVVTHGASHDDYEIVARLSAVGSSSGVNLRAPQRALGRLGTFSTRT